MSQFTDICRINVKGGATAAPAACRSAVRPSFLRAVPTAATAVMAAMLSFRPTPSFRRSSIIDSSIISALRPARTARARAKTAPTARALSQRCPWASVIRELDPTTMEPAYDLADLTHDGERVVVAPVAPVV